MRKKRMYLLIMAGIFIFTGCSANQGILDNEAIEGQMQMERGRKLPLKEMNAIIEGIKEETDKKEVLHITLLDEKPTIFDSKFGGIPYYPKNMELPVNSKGKQLTLLAQINCEDIAQLKNFPHTGMLQFYALNDDYTGMDFDDLTKQEGFRVIYHETIDKSISHKDVTDRLKPYKSHWSYFPISGEYKLNFTYDTEGISTNDYRFDQLFTKKCNQKFPEQKIKSVYDLDREQLYNVVMEETDISRHKMGGYPIFAQQDPRGNDSSLQSYDTLLLQIDSDYEGERIMWGDCGVCNFFINQEDLKKKDFSKVVYNWDCY